MQTLPTALRRLKRYLLPAVVATSFGLAPVLTLAADTERSAWVEPTGPYATSQNPSFLLNMSAPGTVQVDLTSPTANSVLYLTGVTGSPVLAIDNNPTTRHSRITLSLGPGLYNVIAATQDSGLGEFVLSTTLGTLEPCVFAYTNKDYGGTETRFCKGFMPSVINDSYSSFRVPKGAMVRAYQDAGLKGNNRTYYRNVPYVGDGFNDRISSVAVQNFRSTDFFMVIASDTQLTWPNCGDPKSPTGSASERLSEALCLLEQQKDGGLWYPHASKYYNEYLKYYTSVIEKSLRSTDSVVERFGGTIINGDLTAYGSQNGNLTLFKDIYQGIAYDPILTGVLPIGTPLPGLLNSNLYVGLGNHDYDDNVKDVYSFYGRECWAIYINDCATDMMEYMVDQVRTLNPARFDYASRLTSTAGTRRAGSFAYSWDIGNVHFVQLNNYPGYTARWRYQTPSSSGQYYVTPSHTWLRNDLLGARALGQKVIINLHDWGTARSDTEFMDIVNNTSLYGVSAIYSGHLHRSAGRVQDLGVGKAKSYRSGAPHVGTFLLTRQVDNTLYTWLMWIDVLGDGKLYVLDPKQISDYGFASVRLNMLAGDMTGAKLVLDTKSNFCVDCFVKDNKAYAWSQTLY
ncbi:metallophosphoesterase family protein [Methylotetracoccus oryzae]|uniref:hypothetical protein n=1 Tax=Methylotetracoccus oryzae TaxID=1919059 RepID=UPI001117D716|nr:hypothetical protein [Methylotetracoccus oryzae]